MAEPRPPLNYRGPHTPGERRVGRNFGLGLLVGGVLSGLGWALVYLAPGGASLLVLATAEFGKVGFAIAVSRDGRYAGVAPGLVVSFGVALLVYGGLCFYAIQHI